SAGGYDESVQRARRKSDGGLLTPTTTDAVAVWVLQRAVIFDRTPACAMDVVGEGFIATRLHSPQHTRLGHSYGDLDVHPAEADSYNQRRSGSSQDDDDHAVDVYFHVLVPKQRLG